MSTQRNILFFTTSLGKGGAEKHLLRVLNHLDRDRFAPAVALVRAGGTYEKELRPDVPIHHVGDRNVKSSTLGLLRAISPLRHLVRSEEPDVLCSVMDYPNLAALQAVAGMHGPRTVLVVQNTPSMSLGKHGGLVGKVAYRLLPRRYPRADRVVALSKGVEQDLLQIAPRLTGNTEVVYNAGLDAQVRQKARASDEVARPEGVPLLFACGRLTEQKGYPYLLEALALLRKTHPAQLWIAGEGEERAALEAYATELGLAASVRFLGFQRNPYKYMAAADVFVLSSIYEGFGNVLTEAMACGAPVVSTRCPHGPDEIIEDGVSGLLVPPHDPAALATGVARVLDDEALRQRLRANGQRRAREFSAEVVAANYGRVFEEVLNAEHPSPAHA